MEKAKGKVDLDKLNRSKMSRDLGIDVSHVSKIFSKKAKPSLSLAKRMAAYLGITLEDFCEFLGVDGAKEGASGDAGTEHSRAAEEGGRVQKRKQLEV